MLPPRIRVHQVAVRSLAIHNVGSVVDLLHEDVGGHLLHRDAVVLERIDTFDVEVCQPEFELVGCS